MTLRLIVRSVANKELDQAVGFYEQKRPGTGFRLAAEVKQTIDGLLQRPQLHPPVVYDIRKATVNGFPYCIYYRALPDRLIVVAIFHTSRDPTVWQRRR